MKTAKIGLTISTFVLAKDALWCFAKVMMIARTKVNVITKFVWRLPPAKAIKIAAMASFAEIIFALLMMLNATKTEIALKYDLLFRPWRKLLEMDSTFFRVKNAGKKNALPKHADAMEIVREKWFA